MFIKTKFFRLLPVVIFAAGLGGCVTSPPTSPDNLCSIFKEKHGWYKAAKSAESRWHSPIPVMMSFIYQESRFKGRAKPPRTRILWIFPGPRPSSSYGYAQAKKEAWEGYRQDSGHHGADRNDFDDAIDFIGWYNAQTHERNGIANNDAFHLYLAYHEGQGGFAEHTYAHKKWLIQTARGVAARSARYESQLNGCRKELNRHWWWPF
ncbi:MAG: hypothetical protein ABUS47_03250 [Steroidobacter sp.]